MSNARIVRIRLDDRQWIDLRTAALWNRQPTSELLRAIVLDYLRDPKRSPIIQRRSKQPAHRPTVKR